jgi:hypothetical protein
MAEVRAVENRVSIILVDGAYRITMIDPCGRVLTDQVTTSSIPIATLCSLYTRLGDRTGRHGPGSGEGSSSATR